MAVQKFRRSLTRRRKEEANSAKKYFQYVICKNCSSPRLAHHVCRCGFYKGKQVIKVS